MDRFFNDIPAALRQCAADLAQLKTLDLDAQTRAYDLLDAMLEESREYRNRPGFQEAARAFLTAYANDHAVYDEAALKSGLAQRLAPLDEAINEARFKAAAAASLHEFAKEVFEIWQTSGIFARRRALKELRERAGFRLESHRIGNYVAKTFDLANEAQSEFAKAQQARFTADISYKIRPGIHDRIRSLLCTDASHK